MLWLALIALPIDALLLAFIVYSERRTRAYRGHTTVADIVAAWQLLMKSAGRGWFFVHVALLGGLAALISIGSLYRFSQQGDAVTMEVLAVVSYVLFLLLLLVMRLSWELRPPAILFLAASSNRTLLLQNRITKAVNPLQVISYLDYGIGSRETMNTVSGIVVLRTADTADWKSTLAQAVNLVPTIVFDCRTITPALIDEVALLSHPEPSAKVVFVGRPTDRDTLLTRAAHEVACHLLASRPVYCEEELLNSVEESCRAARHRRGA